MSAPTAAAAPAADTAAATVTAVAAAPAPAAAAAPSPTPAAAQATTRTTILVGTRMIDMVLPSAAPIETYIDDAVSVLNEVLQDSPDTQASVDLAAQGQWTFARPGAPPLRPDQSLDDAAVVDGSLLTLLAVSRTERYRPLVEDVIDAIAILDETPQFDRSALNVFIWVAIPVLAFALSLVAIIGWAGTSHSPWWALGLGIGGIAVVALSWTAGRRYQNMHLSESLHLAAYPLITVAVALAVPHPGDKVNEGLLVAHAPAIAAAAAAVLFLTLVGRGGPNRRTDLAAFVTIAALAATAAEILVGYGWGRVVPGAAILFGLFTVTAAAKLTVAAARIALPPVPAPGETVQTEELLEPVAGNGSEDPEKPTQTWQAIIDSVPDSAARLTERSALARQLLIGFVGAGALVLAAGAVATVVRGHYFVPTLVLAGLITMVCGFRSRLYADRWCAWALLAATVAVPVGVTIRLSIWYPGKAWLFLTIMLAAALLALAVAGATAAVHRFSPVQKRVLELLDGATVAAIVPMVLWVTGTFDHVRSIQF